MLLKWVGWTRLERSDEIYGGGRVVSNSVLFILCPGTCVIDVCKVYISGRVQISFVDSLCNSGVSTLVYTSLLYIALRVHEHTASGRGVEQEYGTNGSNIGQRQCRKRISIQILTSKRYGSRMIYPMWSYVECGLTGERGTGTRTRAIIDHGVTHHTEVRRGGATQKLENVLC